ncbi:MAG: DUF1552 domain-containing protein [Pirellulales bacterium]
MTVNLPRRTFLKGLGVSLGLPLLEVMSPVGRRTLQAAEQVAAGTPARRMAFVFFPNGAIIPSWKPEQTGRDFKFSETLSVLEPHREYLNVITGLAQDNGRAKEDGAGDHARSAATFLTGARPLKSSDEIRLGISVDQQAAMKIGHLTRLPSLELGLEPSRNAGNCDSGYSCAYSSNISWKSSTTPMGKEIVPKMAFERLFGEGNTSTEAAAEREFYRRSVLDVVASDATRLMRRVSQADRRKLDEYFSSLRDLERRIEAAPVTLTENAPKLDLPDDRPSDLTQHIRLMYDIMVLAFQTDTTRVATFMLANDGSNRTYEQVGVTDGHHNLSHHRNDAEIMAKLQKIDQYLVSQFGYFLDRLRATPEGEGNLLDQSMIMYGGGLSDGNRHNHDDLPILLAGKAGGSIDTGRHIVCGSETPLNNLFVSLLDRMGAGVDRLGDSTGRLTEL